MNYISPEKFFSLDALPLILDVRTPAEFAKGHIPNALNLPLFDDKERAEVGTLYKQKSKEAAILRGLEIAGAKMSSYVVKAKEMVKVAEVGVHCWRGGKRSESMATLLSFVGFKPIVIEGGYKAYRQFIREKLTLPNLKLHVLGGKTGSGKTDVLNSLNDLGEQVIDLEKLAHHKGSAFGALGEKPQPTSEQFENNLFDVIRKLDFSKRIWLENESKSIGRIFIPDGFWQQMNQGVYFEMEVPFENRVARLVKDYGSYPKEDLIVSVKKIQKRLGGQHVKKAIEHYEKGELAEAAEITLNYYDKAYQHGTDQKRFERKYRLETSNNDPKLSAEKLIKFANEFGY
jgi:tRNA 2-selenouridine synthase